jgi:hypothetical protein
VHVQAAYVQQRAIPASRRAIFFPFQNGQAEQGSGRQVVAVRCYTIPHATVIRSSESNTTKFDFNSGSVGRLVMSGVCVRHDSVLLFSLDLILRESVVFMGKMEGLLRDEN